MGTHDPDLSPELPPGAEAPAGTSRVPVWAWALVAGLAAGLTSWLAGEAAYGRFKPVVQYPVGWEDLSPFERSARLSTLTREAIVPAEAKNTAIAFGALGAALGAGLGLVGGLARRSPRAAVGAAALGAVTGAVAGAGMSAVMTPVFFRHLDPDSTTLLMPLATHAGIWGAVGAAGGLALGAGLGGWRAVARGVTGGLAGAVLGTLFYEVINAVAFSLVRVQEPTPGERLPRLLAHLAVALSTALGAGLAVHQRGQQP